MNDTMITIEELGIKLLIGFTIIVCMGFMFVIIAMFVGEFNILSLVITLTIPIASYIIGSIACRIIDWR